MISKPQPIVTNIVGSILFLCIPVFTSPDFDTNLNFLSIGGFQRSFINYIILLIFYFTNLYIFLPKLFYNRRKLLYYLFVLMWFSIIVLIHNYLPFEKHHLPIKINEGFFGAEAPPPYSFQDNFNHPMKKHPLLDVFDTIPFLLVLSFSFVVKINSQIIEIKNEKFKSEISYLKAQINPHFLFNTLNSLYALTIIKSDEAPQAILKLSSLMRYVVTESSQDFVSLAKEINYIHDYIELQKLRMNEEVNFSFSFTGDQNGKRIAPLILIPFIENVFKYGLNPDEESEIKIEIIVTDTSIILITKNKMVVHAISEDLKTETGLENTKKKIEFYISK